MARFEIGEKDFLLDGQPFRLLAGAIHYFRVPREYWRDRLRKLKACGFNTVETYVAWNIHEKTEGTFDFSGNLDLCAFLDLAREMGLYAIVRPGPYICSEWEFGGLPWWLLKKPGIRLRCMNVPYIQAVDRFFEKLLPALAVHQITRGGNILMMQVENEYGSYGDDKEYLAHLAGKMRELGIEVPLFTSDGAGDFMLTGGTLPDIHKTANFGSDPKGQFAKLRQFQPQGPLMCCEFWNGWFDHWTEEHHRRNPETAAQVLDEMLEMGANVSAYMFHGGTNFGYWNGANCMERYEPTVNSYDDDAPVNECGDLTEKYHLFRRVIGKYLPVTGEVPENLPKAKYGEVRFSRSAGLFENLQALTRPVHAAYPMTMEELDQGYGFVLYKTHVAGPREKLPLVLMGLHDRAQVYVNGEFAGVYYRNDEKPALELAVPPEGMDLAILVENMGRTNYGYNMLEWKGVTGGVRLGQAFVYGWENCPLPLEDLRGVRFTEGTPAFRGLPLLMQGEFEISGEPADTFVKLPGFKKGLIYVNGRLLSRYWEAGPQRSAYLPAPWLKRGVNEITVLELEGFDAPRAILDDREDIG